MSREEYINKMLVELDCNQLKRVYNLVHHMFIRIARKGKSHDESGV
jgi:hypothetical protein